jgi:hypothetical protein
MLGCFHSFGLFAVRALALTCLQHHNEEHLPRENCRVSDGGCVRVQTSGSLAPSPETQSEGGVGGHFDDTLAGHHSKAWPKRACTAAVPAYVLCFDWSLSNKADSIDVLHGRVDTMKGGCHSYSIILSLAGAPAQWERLFLQVAYLPFQLILFCKDPLCCIHYVDDLFDYLVAAWPMVVFPIFIIHMFLRLVMRVTL